MVARAFAILLTIVAVVGCNNAESLATDPCGDRLEGGDWSTCMMEAYPQRSFDVLVPEGDGPFPVILGMHGGGGNRQSALRGTCPEGDEKSPECLFRQAVARGYVFIAPDGTSRKWSKRKRSWNGGGGVGDWRCTGGPGCEDDVDDTAYIRAVLEDVGRRVKIDREKVFVTGISNGGTISYRLACELEGVRAIFAIGGTMQWTTGKTCAPAKPVAVAHAHGTEDPCWPYTTGPTRCPIGQKDKKMKGVDDSMKEWETLLQCQGEPTVTNLPDTKPDGTTTTQTDWPGCRADLRLYKIRGAGHTWPRGAQYLPESVVGKTPQDWGNEVVLDWFDAHR